MHTARTLVATSILSVLALSGCSGDKSEKESGAAPTLPATSSSASPTQEAPEPETSSRGNLVKVLGQEAGFCTDTDCNQVGATFTIDAITVDLPCTNEYSEPAENGHLVSIAMRAATSPDMPDDMFLYFSPSDFKVIGADGLTVGNLGTFAAFSCLDDSEMFPQEELGRGQQYAGQIVLDSPTPSGVLIYAPSGSGTGWEWQF